MSDLQTTATALDLQKDKIPGPSFLKEGDQKSVELTCEDATEGVDKDATQEENVEDFLKDLTSFLHNSIDKVSDSKYLQQLASGVSSAAIACASGSTDQKIDHCGSEVNSQEIKVLFDSMLAHYKKLSYLASENDTTHEIMLTLFTELKTYEKSLVELEELTFQQKRCLPLFHVLLYGKLMTFLINDCRKKAPGDLVVSWGLGRTPMMAYLVGDLIACITTLLVQMGWQTNDETEIPVSDIDEIRCGETSDNILLCQGIFKVLSTVDDEDLRLDVTSLNYFFQEGGLVATEESSTSGDAEQLEKHKEDSIFGDCLDKIFPQAEIDPVSEKESFIQLKDVLKQFKSLFTTQGAADTGEAVKTVNEREKRIQERFDKIEQFRETRIKELFGKFEQHVNRNEKRFADYLFDPRTHAHFFLPWDLMCEQENTAYLLVDKNIDNDRYIVKDHMKVVAEMIPRYGQFSRSALKFFQSDYEQERMTDSVEEMLETCERQAYEDLSSMDIIGGFQHTGGWTLGTCTCSDAGADNFFAPLKNEML